MSPRPAGHTDALDRIGLACPTCEVDVMDHEASQCLDEWVASTFMGWYLFKSLGETWASTIPVDRRPRPDHWNGPLQGPGDRQIGHRPSYGLFTPWSPSRDQGAMWDLVERARVLMEADPYDRLHLACEWRGPLYKGVDFYLTLEGYGMGTSCWYVAVAAGRRYNVTHPSDARVAACRAAIVLHAAIALKQESYARGAYGEA